MKLKKIIVVFSLISACFWMVACESAYKVKTNCSTGWTINRYEIKDSETEETVSATQSVYYSVTLNSEKIDEVWVNVSEISFDETEINFNKYNSSNYTETTSSTYKKSVILTKTQVKKSENGWIKVVDDYDFNSSYLCVSFTGGIKINEMVLIGSDGKKMTFSLKRVDVLEKNEKGAIYGFKSEDIEEINLKCGANLLSDEQEKFDNK